ncbi:unnamed protein product [Durusdinium trenchii]|uniref:Phospholipase B-like n=1 Tax=Durusdinium trenchii TaxID=1381693 RepID=A0ABP0JCD2_9DINO
MGYDGRASLYISRIRDAAWEREGLNLEFYRGYNVTWHDPAKYLDALNSLNMFSSDMRLSVEPTGDWNGVHVVNETVLGRCFDRYFWCLGLSELQQGLCRARSGCEARVG